MPAQVPPLRLDDALAHLERVLADDDLRLTTVAPTHSGELLLAVDSAAGVTRLVLSARMRPLPRPHVPIGDLKLHLIDGPDGPDLLDAIAMRIRAFQRTPTGSWLDLHNRELGAIHRSDQGFLSLIRWAVAPGTPFWHGWFLQGIEVAGRDPFRVNADLADDRGARVTLTLDADWRPPADAVRLCTTALGTLSLPEPARQATRGSAAAAGAFALVLAWSVHSRMRWDDPPPDAPAHTPDPITPPPAPEPPTSPAYASPEDIAAPRAVGPDGLQRPRVLLLEARHPDFDHHRGVEYFPFLLGLMDAIGAQARWWTVSAPIGRVLQGQSYALRLDDPLMSHLGRDVASWTPDVVVMNCAPSEELRHALCGHMPAPTLIDLTDRIGYDSTVAEVLDLFPGLPADVALTPGERLVTAVAPRFDRHFAEPALADATESFHRLATRYECNYFAPARDNPFFADLDSPHVAGFRGCTFCFMPVARARRTVPMPELASEFAVVMRQILAEQRDAPARIDRFAYVLDQSRVGDRLCTFLDHVLDAPLKPSTFIAMTRIDTLLAMREALEARIAALAPRGHHLQLVSIGADNLSDVENLRFNKGLVREQVLACHDMMAGLARRFSTTFSFSPLAMILFTPWTRPEDLRINLRAALRMGDDWLQWAMGTALELWEGTPLTDLARRDGLLADHFGSVGSIAMSCIPAVDVVEIPWRFQDARVERMHQLLVRLDPAPASFLRPENDALTEEIRILRRALPAAVGEHYVSTALCIVDAVEALGAAANLAALFAFIRDHAPTLDAPDRGESATPSKPGPDAV